MSRHTHDLRLGDETTHTLTGSLEARQQLSNKETITIRNSCFLSYSKKRRKLSKKTGMMSTKHHLKSDQPKHAKNMEKIALNMDNVYLDVPVLKSPCLVVVILISGS
jgi:hypothetical protein